MKAIILDTETTGLENSEVIELAFAEVGENLMPSGDVFHSYYKPEKPSTLGALAVHHILPSDLEGRPPSNKACIPPGVEYLIGHNIDFDWKALGEPPVKRICTLALARSVWPTLDSHSQTALMYHLLGQNDATKIMLKQAHSAIHDIGFCGMILRHIVDTLRTPDLETLYQQSELARVPTKMTFGKYKGTAIKDVPRDYVLWYRRQDDQDPYLLKAFKLAGK